MADFFRLAELTKTRIGIQPVKSILRDPWVLKPQNARYILHIIRHFLNRPNFYKYGLFLSSRREDQNQDINITFKINTAGSLGARSFKM